MSTRASRNIDRLFKLSSKRVLDIGCGRGDFLKDFGPGSLGITADMGEVSYGADHGLSIKFGNAEAPQEEWGRFDVIWANNLFEHLLSPHRFLMKLRTISNDKSLLVLGVPVVPFFPSLMKIDKFRGALASNHINFFTGKTLSLTVSFAGWNIESVRPFIFANRFLDTLARPFAPHLYVVARLDPAFQYPFKKYNEWKDDPAFAELLAITKQQ
jgi:SAM-dependent methyltransferase